MKLDDFKVAVRPGQGLVGRFPTGVLLLVGDDGANAHDRLIGLFTDGTDVGPRLEAMFAEPDAAQPTSTFAAVVETDRGMAVYLHGPLEVAADSPNAELRAWGPATGDLQRYDAPDGTRSLSIRAAGEQISAETASLSLRTGLVSGGGLLLHREDAAALDDMDSTAGMAGMAELVDAKGMAAMTDHRIPAMAGTPAGPATATMTAATMTTAARNSAATRTSPMPAPPAPPRPTPMAVPRAPSIPPPPPPAASTVTGRSAAGWPNPSPPADLPGLGTPADTAAPATTAPTPTYGTRLAARFISSAVVGGLVTFLLAFVLPVGFAPLDEVYLTTFVALGLLFVLGALVWDTASQFAQRRRRARDWPVPLFLLLAVPEAALAYGVQTLLLPNEFLVDEIALAIDVAVTAVLIAAGVVVLGLLPPTRRLLHRAPAPVGDTTATGPALPGAPMTEHAGTSGAAGSSTPLVWGINCQQGHFNRPDARYCAACGTAMHGLTHEPRQGPRPPLGYLIGDDGVSHVLDHDVVLGTAPHDDAKVRGGQATGLTVADGTGLLAAAHADVALVEWDVTVVDRGHPQGTHVREPDSATWVRLAPGQPFTLASGSRIRLGSRDLTYHAANTR